MRKLKFNKKWGVTFRAEGGNKNDRLEKIGEAKPSGELCLGGGVLVGGGGGGLKKVKLRDATINNQ